MARSSLGWSVGSRSPYLVDEERPPIGLLEEPGARGRRPGERAALVAEELRLEEVRGHRGAIEDDERTARARPRFMNRLREDLLAGAGLPFDEDGDVGLREPLAQRVEGAHRGARADDPTEARAG